MALAGVTRLDVRVDGALTRGWNRPMRQPAPASIGAELPWPAISSLRVAQSSCWLGVSSALPHPTVPLLGRGVHTLHWLYVADPPTGLRLLPALARAEFSTV